MLNCNILKNDIREKDRVLVGVSGGADSMCLLDLLCKFREEVEFDLFVVHVNHGIRGDEALRDQFFVQNECEKRKVNYILKEVNAVEFSKQNSKTLEQAARELRYQAFSEVQGELNIDKVVLAHHKDDQAETVLMHIARGSSLKGARGILKNSNKLFRPLLDYTREEVISYNQEHEVEFLNDSTNEDIKYSRNYIRNIIIPTLKKVYPNIVGALSAFAQKCYQDDQFIESLLPKNKIKQENGLVKIPVVCLKSEYPISARLVKYAAELLGVYADIEEKHIQMVIDLADKENNKKLALTNGIIAIKEYENIVLSLKNEKKTQMEYKFGFGEFDFFENGKLLVKRVENKEDIRFNSKNLFIDLDKLPKDSTVRLPKDGDIFKKFSSGTKKLSEFLADKKVPKREREGLVVLANQNRILCVANIEISDDVKIDNNSKDIAVISLKKFDNE